MEFRMLYFYKLNEGELMKKVIGSALLLLSIFGSSNLLANNCNEELKNEYDANFKQGVYSYKVAYAAARTNRLETAWENYDKSIELFHKNTLLLGEPLNGGIHDFGDCLDEEEAFELYEHNFKQYKTAVCAMGMDKMKLKKDLSFKDHTRMRMIRDAYCYGTKPLFEI